MQILQLRTINPPLLVRPYENKKTTELRIPYRQDFFVKSTNCVDLDSIEALNITHFRAIDENSVRGLSLAKQKSEIIAELKKCGIQTVVDLRPKGGEETQVAKDCRMQGLDYYNLKLRLDMPIFKSIFTTKLKNEERELQNKEFVSMLPRFFEIMNNGRYYMACLLGLHRTDLAVTMNYLLNPKEPKNPPKLSHLYFQNETNATNRYIGAVKNLIRNLKKEDYKTLGFAENFRDIFNLRIDKLRLVNIK